MRPEELRRGGLVVRSGIVIDLNYEGPIYEVRAARNKQYKINP